MTQTARFAVSLTSTQTSSPDLGSGKVEQALSVAKDFASGTTNDKADLTYIDERTLASNTSEDLDLYGSLASVFGATLNMAEIVAVVIESDAANTTNLTLGGASAEAQLWFAAAGDKEIIKPGGVSAHMAPAGWAITATSADGLKVSNATGGSATYRIGVLARSA